MVNHVFVWGFLNNFYFLLQNEYVFIVKELKKTDNPKENNKNQSYTTNPGGNHELIFRVYIGLILFYEQLYIKK